MSLLKGILLSAISRIVIVGLYLALGIIIVLSSIYMIFRPIHARAFIHSMMHSYVSIQARVLREMEEEG